MTDTEARFQVDPTAAVLSRDTLLGLSSIAFQHPDAAMEEHIARAVGSLPPVITEDTAENIFLGVESFIEVNPHTIARLLPGQGRLHARAALDYLALRAQDHEEQGLNEILTVEGIASYLQKRDDRRSRNVGQLIAKDSGLETIESLVPDTRRRRFVKKIAKVASQI